MIWFYSQMEEVMVPSAGTREQLQSRGLPPDRMKPLPRWVDTDVYSPEMRNPDFWKERCICHGRIVLLYVGRVSREKGLEMLTGEQLQRGYASSDLFVFPSSTDTFGNVVQQEGNTLCFASGKAGECDQPNCLWSAACE